MSITFDPVKDALNIEKHGISLARAQDLDILSYALDDRTDYGEVRIRAWGMIDGAYYCLVYTLRDATIRAISLRRAHRKEIERHVDT